MKMNEELEGVVKDIKESVTNEVKETVMPAITKEVFEQMKADLPNRKKELFGDDFQARDEVKELQQGKEQSAEFIRSVMNGDSQNVKSLSTGTASDGGTLVPVNFSNEIIRLAPKFGVVRRDARNYGVSDTGNSTKLPTVGSVAVSRVSEKGAIPAVQPTTGQISIDIKKLAGITPMSNELLKDAGPDVVDILTTLYAEAFAKAEDTWGFQGLAAGEGIFQNTSVPVLTLGTGDLTYDKVDFDDLLNALDLLDDDAAGNAKWYMTFSMFNALRKRKDVDGRYLIQEPHEGRPYTIWNLPIQLVRTMPRTSDSSQANKKFMAVGDLSYMLFADKKEYSFEISREATIKDTDGSTAINLWEQDMSAVRVIERIDIQLAEAAKAFAVVKTAAST